MIYPVLNLYQNIPGAKHFFWREFLYLKSLEAYVFPNNVIVDELIQTAFVMEKIRTICGDRAINTHDHSVYRPYVYNKVIKGALHSYHVKGMACDFSVKGLSCDLVRAMLEPHLIDLDIRMENKKGSNWVHIDRGKVIKNRFFKP